MKALRTLILGVSALIASGGLALAADWTKIRIGTEGAYPPFNYVDTDGELKGFDIEIAQALCDQMKAECSFVAQDWDGIIPALLAKKYDAIIASMSITEERKKKVAFTSKYYKSPARFVMNKGSGVTATEPSDMAGKVIGAQSSTIHSGFLEDVYSDSDIRLYPTQDDANADLVAGRLDAVLADSIVLMTWMDGSDDGKCCEFVGGEYSDVKYFGEGAGIAVRQEDEALKAKLDEALAAIVDNGVYKTINDKYFPFSVY